MDLSGIRLMAVDMDGTLLNSNHEVSADFWALYDQLMAAGVCFVAASGRQRDSIRQKLAPVASRLTVIAENGALGVHAGSTFVKTVLPKGAQARILAKIAGHNDIFPVLCTPDQAFVRADQVDFRRTMSEYYSSHTTVDQLESVDAEVMKVALYHPIDSETFIYPLVCDLAPELVVKVSGKNWVDISHPDANKGFALERLQSHLGITPAQTLAIGDYNNDLEMLARADFSFAMANAHPRVQDAAKYRTSSNNDQGVERIMRQVLEHLSA